MTARFPLAALAVVLMVLAAGCGGDTSERSAQPSVSSATGTPTATPTPTTTPTPTPTPTPGPVSVPVYFVGSTPHGPQLFAELRTVDARDAVDQALTALAAGPHDPDYTSYLRPGRLRMESHDESAVLVVPDAQWATRPDGLTDRQAQLALQQVVLTLQAALGEKVPASFVTSDLAAIRGGFFGLTPPPDQNGYVATKGLSLFSGVNVLTPSDGQTVGGSFRASGLQASFEGTVGYRVLDATGRRVVDNSCQARITYVRRLAPWQCRIDVSSLDPGHYTFVALTDTGSLEGPGPDEDTKTITVS